MCQIPISRFFRDKAVYKLLTLKVLPDCADVIRKRGGTILRLLSAGCASGEEPYTISMIWQFYLSRLYPEVELQILALDIDDVMLRHAEAALPGFPALSPPGHITAGLLDGEQTFF